MKRCFFFFLEVCDFATLPCLSFHDNTLHHIATHKQHRHSTPRHTKHILLSSTDTGPLHSKWHEACTGIMDNFLLHDANMFARQGMIQSTCTLAHRVSQSRVYRESQLSEKERKMKRKNGRAVKRERERREIYGKRERREEMDTRRSMDGVEGERRRDCPRRSRVYFQNAPMCTFKTLPCAVSKGQCHI